MESRCSACSERSVDDGSCGCGLNSVVVSGDDDSLNSMSIISDSQLTIDSRSDHGWTPPTARRAALKMTRDEALAAGLVVTTPKCAVMPRDGKLDKDDVNLNWPSKKVFPFKARALTSRYSDNLIDLSYVEGDTVTVLMDIDSENSAAVDKKQTMGHIVAAHFASLRPRTSLRALIKRTKEQSDERRDSIDTDLNVNWISKPSPSLTDLIDEKMQFEGPERDDDYYKGRKCCVIC